MNHYAVVAETKIVYPIVCQNQTNKYKISRKKRSDLWQIQRRGGGKREEGLDEGSQKV